MTVVQGTRKNIKRSICYICIAVLIATMIAGLGTLIGIGWESGISALGALVLLLIFGASVVGTLATTEVIPWNSLSWSLLRDSKVIGALSLALIPSLGTVAGFVDVMGDNGGIDAAFAELADRLSGIEETTINTNDRVKEIETGLEKKGIIGSKTTAIEQAIDGVWGQSDCSNTYRFTLSPAGERERVLMVESLKSAEGLAPFEGEYSFTVAKDQFGSDGFLRSILTTEELKGFDPGFAVEFILVRAGSSEKLIWDSKSSELNAPELVRCPS